MAPSCDDHSVQAENAYLVHLGNRVRDLREARGMTRRELADAAGISDRYVFQFECGRGNMSVLLLRRLASALDVPVERLVAELAPAHAAGNVEKT